MQKEEGRESRDWKGVEGNETLNCGCV